ncbi:MAG TPA: HlyD family efflux transporter periplasmic adaptor subunit [Planctomycetes bacterium]|nr:HlyD family efflux transporter periplasmic adaptor subunit [Planctomycetota bacterium]
MKKSRKIIVAIIIVLVVLVVGVSMIRKARLDKKIETVRIEKAERGVLVELVSAPGEIEPKKKVDISAKVSARIVELPHKEGDRVTRGDPEANPPVPASILVQLDAKDLESHLRSAQATRSAQAARVEVEKATIASQQSNLEGLAASFEEAKRDFERKKGLLNSQDISQSVFDQAKYRAEGLRAQVAAAKHTLESARLNLVVLKHNIEAADAAIAQAKEALSYTTITSPINGVITLINAEVGEVVMTGTMNNPGTVILQVADLSQMLVVAQVDEADIGELEVGQRAKVSVRAFSDIDFTGTVDTIALTHRFSDNRTKYFRTEILLDNSPDVAKLYSGLTADVDIQTRTHKDVLKVPSQAVLAREIDLLPLGIRENSPHLDKSKTHAIVVYRYIDGKAVVTPVKIGSSDLTHTIITAGISEEDEIVAGPFKVLDTLEHDQKLKDERQVKPDSDKAVADKAKK